jgi:hypothetical protein
MQKATAAKGSKAKKQKPASAPAQAKRKKREGSRKDNEKKAKK